MKDQFRLAKSKINRVETTRTEEVATARDQIADLNA